MPSSIKSTTKKDLAKKISDLEKARSFVFSDQLLDAMIQEKKALLKAPVNYATEKLELNRKIHIAAQENDIEAKEMLLEKVKSLEQAQLSSRVESKLDGFSDINKKNRQMNRGLVDTMASIVEVVKVVEDCELVADDWLYKIDLTPYLL